MAVRPDRAADLGLFDAYFARADLDRDGRISSNEAVAFFQGFNLPRHVLAQIWMYADQKRAGFLMREEFYNALKLVTVAQRGIELTPNIVQTVFSSPEGAKIPVPKVDTLPDNASQMRFAATTPSSQMGGMGLANPGVRGQPPLPNSSGSQYSSPSGNHLMRPPPPTPYAASGQVPPSGSGPGISHPPGSGFVSVSTDWFSARNSGALLQETAQTSVMGVPPLAYGFGASNFGSAPGPSKPRDSTLPSLHSDSRSLVLADNGFSSDSSFGGDAFSTTETKQEKTVTNFSRTAPNSSTPVPAIFGSQNSSKPLEVDPRKSVALVPSNDSQLQQPLSQVKHNQLDMNQSHLPLTSSSGPVGSAGPTSTQVPFLWPNFTKSDIQRYLGIFIKVDNNRDGKITGEEARNLFLSWRLPREVLKQVWDLSDQDNDGMLSLREFCIALYLMERHREKYPLPSVLPDSVSTDQTLLLATSQPVTGYGGPVTPLSKPTPGIATPQPTMLATPVKQQMQKTTPQGDDGTTQSLQQKSRVPVLEKYLVDQLSKEEQSALNSKSQEASDAEKKVQELEKEILESKEKTEFYRSKMQELVLYKSRCDGRLNEITERASADKREVETLTKKYEQKYKQAGHVASNLTIEEATFRDIQEKKLEIYNAILKIEQGENGDGSLQSKADNIQKDLEELVKILNERCKQYGLRSKPTTLIELPFGWQPGIQDGAADWDDDREKLEEDGFAVIKELTIEVEKAVSSQKFKPQEVQRVSQTSPSNGESDIEKAGMTEKTEKTNSIEKIEKPSKNMEPIADNGATNLDSSETIAKIPATPGASSMLEDSEDHQLPIGSSHANKNSSDHDAAAESYTFEDKHNNEPSWGPAFDRNDDTDSEWGYNPKENDNQKRRQNISYGSDDFGLFPTIKTVSPSAASVVGKEKGLFFDSVPSTPQYNSGFSPRFTDEDHHSSSDSFSQHDFFSTHDTVGFAHRENLARFDSFRSTTDYNRGENVARFDSMQSTIDYGRGESFARIDSMRSTTDYGRGESFARFDSMRSTTDSSGGFLSFDGGDLFGSGPFKSLESHSPKKGTTNWDAF